MRRSRIALKLSYRCSGRCPYCSYRKALWATRGGRDMPLEMVEWIARRLEDGHHPFEEISLTGGEVTTLPTFPAIARRLTQTGVALGVTTAGWANRVGSWATLLNDISIEKVCVSIDHPDPRLNDAVRGKGSWERAARAVQEAVAARDRLGYPEVTVISVIHRHNIRALESLWMLLKQWRVDRWMPAHLEASARYRALAPSQADLEWLADARVRSIGLHQALGSALDSRTVPDSLVLSGCWPEDQVPNGCAALGRLLIVHPNGGVYGCYGSEHLDIARVGEICGSDFPSFTDLLAKDEARPPEGCARCPEPIQHSNPLR